MKQALGLLIIMGGGFIIYSALTNKAWVQALIAGTLVQPSTQQQQTSTAFAGTQNNVNTTGHGYTP